METKTILRQLFANVTDQLAHKDLPLIWFIGQQNDHKLVADHRWTTTTSHVYLDLMAKALVLLDIDSNTNHHLSTIDETMAITERLDIVFKELELRHLNASLVKSSSELKAATVSLEEVLNESIREMKKEEGFESIICDKINFYSTKLKEYYTSVKSKEASLARVGFTDNLTHEAIDAYKQTNEELRRRLHDTNARLNQYKDFNPTETDLKHRIDEMKAEINEYDNYFEK